MSAPVVAIATHASPVTAMVPALKHLCRHTIIATLTSARLTAWLSRRI